MEYKYEEVKIKVVDEGKMSASDFEFKVVEKMKDFNGMISNVGAAMIVSNEANVSVDLTPVTYKKIKDLTEDDKMVQILGTIVNVGAINYYTVCNTCGSRIKESEGFKCKEHGTVEKPKYSYVTNITLDDGSGPLIKVVCFKKQTEILTGRTEETLQGLRENEEGKKDVAHSLLGEIFSFRGNVNKTDFGNEFNARLVITDDDEIKKIMEKMKEIKKSEEPKEVAAPLTSKEEETSETPSEETPKEETTEETTVGAIVDEDVVTEDEQELIDDLDKEDAKKEPAKSFEGIKMEGDNKVDTETTKIIPENKEEELPDVDDIPDEEDIV